MGIPFVQCQVLTFGVLKVSYREQNYIPCIGRDTSVTVVAAFGPFLAHTALVMYYYVVIKLLKSFTELLSPESEVKKDLDRKFAILSLFTLGIPVVSFFSSTCILLSLYYTQQQVEFYKVCFFSSFHFILINELID
jgi:hypothetical protein